MLFFVDDVFIYRYRTYIMIQINISIDLKNSFRISNRLILCYY